MTPKERTRLVEAMSVLNPSEVFMLSLGVVTQACFDDALTVVRPAVDEIKRYDDQFERLLHALSVLKIMTD